MKEYVIQYTPESKELLAQRLQTYEPQYFKHIPYCSVRIESEKESSLLETLSHIPGITYREALVRKTQGDDDDHL